jgi:tetratricopeptide (TPR) repeat protein
MRRRASPHRFRKHNAANSPDHVQRSGALRSLRDLIQRGRFGEALAALDHQVAAANTPSFQSQCLSLVADALFKQGKFTEAAEAYQRAGQLAQADAHGWLRPAIGQVRSLLRAGSVAAAQERALILFQTARTRAMAYQTALASLDATLAATGQAQMPAQPPPPAFVAGRLARQFLGEGEPAAAKALLQQAAQANPSSVRARLGLAEIALREKDAATAARLAREAVILGQYRAKTLPAWNLLLASGRSLGRDTLDRPLLNGLAQATPSVRSRAVLLIAKGLRAG